MLPPGCLALCCVMDPRSLVAGQLGYEVENFKRVARWTTDGMPAVIESYPLRRDTGKPVPFPTIYWLSDQRLSAAVAGLEKVGGVAEAREFIVADKGRIRRLEECHDRYRRRRYDSLTPDDRTLATRWHGFLDTGIAGMKKNFVDVKCLHAHYAHYLGDDAEPRNPIGEWVHHAKLPDDVRALVTPEPDS
mmetsp:Transcript_8699/g.28477  ORF Transcript_8699/g.28477 Transcript_8699/m.28477 type:complete len:190 (+) Transcript_8699:62-631(+)